MQKTLILSIIFMFLAGCSHVTTVSTYIVESVEMLYPEQYLSKTKKPNYFIDKNKSKSKQTGSGRNLASVKNQKIKSNVRDQALSNKQVYFKTLFGQYLTLQATLGKSKEKYVCPAFHHMVVTEFSHQIKSNNNKPKKFKGIHRNFSRPLSNHELLPAYPVLALDYNGNNNETTFTHLRNKNQKKLSQSEMKTILNFYLKNIEEEVNQICDKGYSADYYLYENFVTVVKNNKQYFDSGTYIKAHLKISIFSNMYLLDYLNDTSKFYAWRKHNALIDNLASWEKEALRRTDGNSFISYLYHVSSLRHNRPVYTMKSH